MALPATIPVLSLSPKEIPKHLILLNSSPTFYYSFHPLPKGIKSSVIFPLNKIRCSVQSAY